MKKAEAEALRKLVNLISEAAEGSQNKGLGWRSIIRMDPERRIPKFEIEDTSP